MHVKTKYNEHTRSFYNINQYVKETNNKFLSRYIWIMRIAYMLKIMSKNVMLLAATCV